MYNVAGSPLTMYNVAGSPLTMYNVAGSPLTGPKYGSDVHQAANCQVKNIY